MLPQQRNKRGAGVDLQNPLLARRTTANLLAQQYARGFPYSTKLEAHTGCINALSCSKGDGRWLASAGDDMRVLLWNAFGQLDGSSKPVAAFTGADVGRTLPVRCRAG